MKQLVCLFLLAGCPRTAPNGAEDAHSGAHAHDVDADAHASLPNRVAVTDEVAKQAKVRTEPLTLRALAGTLDLTGEIAPDPDARAVVTARIAGRVVDVRFRENGAVKAGEPLVVIESAELAKSRAALTAAQAKAAAAKKTLERVTSVAEKGLASGQEVEAARADAAVADAEALAAKQVLSAFGQQSGEDAARLTIVSPISGRVISRTAIRGETVTPERVLAEIADLSSAYFVARVFEKDVELVSKTAAAEVRLNAYPAERFEGKVESVAQAVDPQARTVLARIRIANERELLKVGLFGTAHVALQSGSTKTPRLVVPVSAVTEIGGKKVVFVEAGDHEFAVHEVALGRSAEGFFEVQGGLRESDRVVVEGAFTLKSLLLKSTFGEEE